MVDSSRYFVVKVRWQQHRGATQSIHYTAKCHSLLSAQCVASALLITVLCCAVLCYVTCDMRVLLQVVDRESRNHAFIGVGFR